MATPSPLVLLSLLLTLAANGCRVEAAYFRVKPDLCGLDNVLERVEDACIFIAPDERPMTPERQNHLGRMADDIFCSVMRDLEMLKIFPNAQRFLPASDADHLDGVEKMCEPTAKRRAVQPCSWSAVSPVAAPEATVSAAIAGFPKNHLDKTILPPPPTGNHDGDAEFDPPVLSLRHQRKRRFPPPTTEIIAEKYSRTEAGGRLAQPLVTTVLGPKCLGKRKVFARLDEENMQESSQQPCPKYRAQGEFNPRRTGAKSKSRTLLGKRPVSAL